MPIYEYECRKCGIRFDKMQHFKDEPLTTCPECGGSLHRLIQPVGIIFKGSGFYTTDHRSSSSACGPSRKAETPEKGDAHPETSESKASSAGEGGETKTSKE